MQTYDSETNITNTNILIIGKTGVGKSSLLNYFLGPDTFAKAQVGNTRPTTPKGIKKYTPVRYNSLELTIYDSWGLEPDKAEEWKNIINNEVKDNDLKNIKDWFHTIIYCIDAQRARIEQFEYNEILYPLMESGNNICFALTKCDIAKPDEIQSMHMELRQKFENPIISEVCSVAQKMRTGKITEQFGKDNLSKAICSNLWDNIGRKILVQYKKRCFDRLYLWRQDALNYYDGEAGPLGIFTNYNDLMQRVNDYATSEAQEIMEYELMRLSSNINYALNIHKEYVDGFGTSISDVNKFEYKNFNSSDWAKYFWENCGLIEKALHVGCKLFPLLGLFAKSSYRPDVEKGLDHQSSIIKDKVRENALFLTKELHISVDSNFLKRSKMEDEIEDLARGLSLSIFTMFGGKYPE